MSRPQRFTLARVRGVVLALIQEGRYPSASIVAKRLRCSSRTAWRYLNRLPMDEMRGLHFQQKAKAAVCPHCGQPFPQPPGTTKETP